MHQNIRRRKDVLGINHVFLHCEKDGIAQLILFQQFKIFNVFWHIIKFAKFSVGKQYESSGPPPLPLKVRLG